MIVCIHGAGDSPEQWDPLRAALSGRELLAFDAPASLDADCRPSAVAALVAASFDGRAAVVGFSWGASVAACFAARYPERVERLVLVEGGHVDFADLPGFEPPASREALVAEHGLDGALHWGLVQEPNAGTWPALARASFPVVLIASTMTERFAAAVPRAEIVPGAGHEIDYETVARALDGG